MQIRSRILLVLVMIMLLERTWQQRHPIFGDFVLLKKNLSSGLIWLLLSPILSCKNPSPSISAVESDALGRRAMNVPHPYQPQALQGPDSEGLHRSLLASRDLAWQVFALVAGTVEFQSTLKNGQKISGQLPRFLTWYTAEDLQRLFRSALKQSSKQQILQGVPLSEEQYARAEVFLAQELDGMPDPLQNRFQLWLKQHPNPSMEDWAGLGGTSRVYYSPGLIKQLLKDYTELGLCFQGQQRPAALGDDPSCLKKPLAASAAIVKAAWFNAKSTFKSFNSSASALSAMMQIPNSSWEQLAVPTPVPENILAARVGQERLLLPGFHIMTRDREDWLWITAWWSADKDLDFGADRPDFVRAMGPAFGHYKICAVTSFKDDAQDLDALAKSYPDLVAAFRAAQAGNANASWCSNPYLEAGVDNQRTNCIGCHQFAGTDARQDSILHDAALYPAHGSDQIRHSFPTEFIWSAGFGGQNLFQIISSNLVWHQNLPENFIEED